MRRRSAYWIDAFTDKPLGGNPCLVVFDADDIPIETRIAIVRETRLSECAFLVRSDKADFGARYYTAVGEILMAGHPTVATVSALIEHGALTRGSNCRLEVGAGVLPIAIEHDGAVRMTQPAPKFGARFAPSEVAPVLGLLADCFDAPPETVSTGTPFLICPLNSVEALNAARLDLDAYRALKARSDCDFVDLFLTADAPDNLDADTYSRMLMSPPEPPEDPFTGSATGCMAAWRWARGSLASPEFTAAQGDGMGRPGRAKIRVLGPRDAIEGVEVSGRAAVLMRGEIEI